MSRAPHPVFKRLMRAAAAPAQLVQREQATRATCEHIGAALGRVGLQSPEAWQRLLQLPLVEPGNSGDGLQALLAQIEQGPAVAAADQADALLSRGDLQGPQRVEQRRARGPARAQVPAQVSAAAPAQAPATAPGMGGVARGALAPAASAIAGMLGPAANTRRKGDAVADSWLQRANRAGLIDALFTPVRRQADAGAEFWGAVSAAPQHGLAQRAAVAAASAPVHVAARDAGLAGLAPPVLPLMQATLERIEGAASGASGRSAGDWGARVNPAAHASAAASADAPRTAAWTGGRGAPASPPAQAGEPASTFAQLGRAVAAATSRALPPLSSAAVPWANGSSGLQGLRGLAARAAATSTAGLRPLDAEPAGSVRSADAAIAPMQQAPAYDDEQLAEQLARLLKREAERDGIDVSDVLS